MLRHINLIFILFFFTLSSFANDDFSFYDEKETFLPVEEAFQFQLLPDENKSLIKIELNNAPGYYTYKDKFNVSLEPSTTIETTYPQGEIKEDEFFGKQEVYFGIQIITILLKDRVLTDQKIRIDYQGCSEKGLCYPPSTHIINLEGQSNINYLSETDSFVETLNDRNFLISLISFFLAGLLLSLTPCVLPMVPILSSIVISSNKNHAIRYTLSYVAGVSATYVIFGIAASITGSFLSSSLQNIYFLLFNGFLFLIFALAMFDIFHFNISENNFLSNLLNKINKKNIIHIFFLGLFSALILSPCVAPPLAAAILYISQANDILLGGLSLFIMSIGMSVPLLLIGFSANRFLPKPGIWMVKVKKLIGFVLIGMSIYIIRPLLDEVVFYLLLNTLLTITIFYYLFFTENKIATLKIVLILGLLFSVCFNIYHTKNYIDKDINLSSNEKPKFIVINSVEQLDNIIASNKAKPVMLDFYADWCVACLEFEKFTFTDKEVNTLMQQYILLKADVTENNQNDKALMKRFSIFGPPAILFFNNSGDEVKQIRTIGFKNPKDFKKILQIGLD
ncbi:MAG: protein-disulfide reductase DsbD [Methylophilaceae bacterium]|nr:protein-disulfide reductase DsbD [Methylophilaceae bacterium]